MGAVEAHPEAAKILEAAGWKPHPQWGVYTRGTLVMGVQPDDLAFLVKDWNATKPGDPRYGPDTPDEPHEAAQWLVDRFKAEQAANALHTETVLAPPRIVLDEPGELGEDSGDEAHSEACEEADGAGHGDGLQDEGDDASSGGSGETGGSGVVGSEGAPWGSDAEGAAHVAEVDAIDADFSEPAPELGQELAEEHPEEFGGAAFIFGDNLDQRRTAAIGMVMQAALRRLPAAINYAQLAELRNFTMGVSEGRWPDNAAKRDELDALEETERTRRRIEQARDDKVSALMAATREEIEAFDPEAGWPQ